MDKDSLTLTFQAWAPWENKLRDFLEYLSVSIQEQNNGTWLLTFPNIKKQNKFETLIKKVKESSFLEALNAFPEIEVADLFFTRRATPLYRHHSLPRRFFR